MSIVSAETGEIITFLTHDEARVLTDQIRVEAEGLASKAVLAYTGRAWAALDYRSWDEYCVSEFGSARIKLPRDERTEMVGALRDAGLSTRAIAKVTGVDPKTVRNDLDSGGDFSPPDDDQVEPRFKKSMKVTGTDGKQYASTAQRIDAAKKAHPMDHSPNATHARVELVQRMAAEGYTSRQIAASVGMHRDSLTELRKRHGITVPADAAVGKTQHIDSNRVMTETVNALEADVMAVALVDLAALDATQLDHWVTSLVASLRSLNRFCKQLKEITQ